MNKAELSKKFEQKYSELNKSQKDAVDSIDGPVMVIAGPGTGKTTLLTLRIANILRKTDVTPENILSLTFTNSGVSAMRKKLVELIGDEAYRVNIFTFHSFAEYLMKHFSDHFPDFSEKKVISDLQRVQILEEILLNKDFKELVPFHDKFMHLSKVAGAINDIKKEGLSVEEFAKRIPLWQQELLSDDSMFYKRKQGKFKAGDIKPSEKERVDKKIQKAVEISKVYELYQEKISELGLYDFSDMILNVLRELEKNPNLKLDIQEQYQYVLVDEHQDTNEGQNKLIEYLTDAEHLDGHPNLFTVGDEKQSIYRFQGASVETFKHLESLYRDVKVITLTENYRSTQEILDGAKSLITHTVSDTATLNAFKKSGNAINILEFSNYKFELLHIADDIKEKIKTGVDPNDIAIIYRRNKNIEEIKEVFVQNKIPYTILSKDNLFDDPHIDHLISFLYVVNNFDDSYHLGKILFADFLGLDPMDVVETLSGYNRKSRTEKISLFKFINKKENSENYLDFIKTTKDLKTKSLNSPFTSFFKEFLEMSGYIQHVLASSDSRNLLLKIDKFFDEIKRQSQSVKNYSLSDFIKFVESYKKYKIDIEVHEPEFIDGVKCMTAHKSKGLEFEYVYIVNTLRKNWEKNSGFPKFSIPIDDYKGDVDDERRLFYVAMTRAKNGLTITSSRTDWEGSEREKSQFISEIDEKYLTTSIETKEFERENVDRLVLFMQHSSIDKSIWDKDYIKQLFLKNNLSVTALNNYIECPIKYFLHSLIKLPSEYKSSLMFGNLVHESLEKFFLESKKSGAILPIKKLTEEFKKTLDSSSFYGDEYEKFLEKGLDLLEKYYDSNSKDWIVNISTEQRVKKEFFVNDKESIVLSGVLDKIEYLDSEVEGRIRIVDYKTGKTYSDKDKNKRESLQRQITFYYILMEGYHDGKFTVENAVLDFLEQNKKGENEKHVVSVSEKDIEELKLTIKQMAKDVMSGEFISQGCKKRECEYCKMYSNIN